jgi:hypothetical protein
MDQFLEKLLLAKTKGVIYDLKIKIFLPSMLKILRTAFPNNDPIKKCLLQNLNI